MQQLRMDGHGRDIEFRFFGGNEEEDSALCLVKSRFTDYPIIMGKQPDGSWTCIAHAPVVMADLKEDLSRAIIDYKLLKESL